MTTRQDLRNLCRRRFGDTASPYKFSDLQVNQWINDAIAEHSIYFPRKLNDTISCSDDDKTYDLPFDFIFPLSIEYPTGEDPPEYLIRRPYAYFGSDDVEGFYDIVLRDDGIDVNELWISEKPSTGESIEVQYSAEHASLDDDSDVTTVLDRLLELIVLFVRTCSYQELATIESANPDPTSLSMGTLELNAFRADRAYRIKLDRWLKSESESGMMTWKMDIHDRIY
jgi:hypothetical protein